MIKSINNQYGKILLLSLLIPVQSIIFVLVAQHQVEIPKGRIEKFQFNESKIFPGTVRDVTVYVPAQTNPSIPACVYIQQDGYDQNSRFDSLFNLLISNKKMPVTVGVFIKPGTLPSSYNMTPGRPNRDLEYDGVGDKYVRFVLEEILPYVAEKYKLNLSNKGNDRCIAGVSSGGISAFNAAWEHPEAFSRVYCCSGSFVGFRGGNEFPTLIRKTEAKPIRAYLTVGTKDMENCAGDWNLLNMEMDKALKFSGYDYKFMVKDGYHGAGWNEFFMDAMRYLWKDWPQLIPLGTSAPRVCDIIIPDEHWQLVKNGYGSVRGPACNSKGEVFFTDVIKNKMYRIGVDETVNEPKPFRIAA